MFINNIEKIKNFTFSCGKEVAFYLLSKNVPLLGKKNGRYFFSKNDKLEKALKDMPTNIEV